MKKVLVLFIASLFFMSGAKAQNTFVHGISSSYEWPTDSLVLKKLDHWQDLKFGVLFHWGLYSVPGIVESWALCSKIGSPATVTKTIRSLKTGTGTD